MQNVLLRIKDNSNNILYTVQWLISSESDQGKGDIKREEGSNSGPVRSEYVSAQDSCDPKGVSIDCKQDHSQDEAARHYEVAEENWTTSKNFRLHRQNDPTISCGSSNLVLVPNQSCGEVICQYQDSGEATCEYKDCQKTSACGFQTAIQEIGKESQTKQKEHKGPIGFLQEIQELDEGRLDEGDDLRRINVHPVLLGLPLCPSTC